MTLVAAEHVAADIGGDAWPPVVPRDQLEGGVFPRMSSRGRIVARLDDVGASARTRTRKRRELRGLAKVSTLCR